MYFGPLNLNETHPNFMPTCDHPESYMENVYLTGEMHTLTSDICDAYSTITLIDSGATGLERIDLNAFHGCHQLKELYLADNKLTIIPDDVFKNNAKLESLNLHQNQFKTFEGKIFQHTPMLMKFYFTDNPLEKFLTDDMPILSHLSILDLRGNKEDLNVEKLLKKCPMLIEHDSLPKYYVEKKKD